jgi:hypothetical protein
MVSQGRLHKQNIVYGIPRKITQTKYCIWYPKEDYTNKILYMVSQGRLHKQNIVYGIPRKITQIKYFMTDLSAKFPMKERFLNS